MRRYRLTDIDLDHDGRRFPVGAEVEADVDLPAELLEARKAAGTAELVGEEGSAWYQEAEAAWRSATAVSARALIALLDVVEAGTASDRAAFVDLLSEMSGQGQALTPRFEAILQAALNDTLPPDPASAGTTQSPAAAGEQSGGEPGHEGPAPEAADDEHQSVADDPAAAPAPAATDAPPVKDGVDGDPPAASAAGGEPAAPVDPTPEQTSGSAGEGQTTPPPAEAPSKAKAPAKTTPRKGRGGNPKA